MCVFTKVHKNPICNRITIFENAIAITIAIENRSGKIADRFLFHDRIAFSLNKSISVFHLQIGSRLKTGFLTARTDGV